MYIVCDDKGPLTLGHYRDTPRDGVLMVGKKIEAFKTRRQANAAIQRTKRYASSHGFQWGDRYTVYLVKPPQEQQ